MICVLQKIIIIDGKRRDEIDELIHVLPTHVQQCYIDVASVGIQGILDFKGFGPSFNRKVGCFCTAKNIFPETSGTEIPKEHAAAIKRPY
jgi:hypothetical protein